MNNYYCDFETCLHNEKAKVWLACALNSEDNTYSISTNIEQFLKGFKNSSNLYFHNLKYDGSYLLNYLLNNNFKWTNNKKLENNQFSTLIDKFGVFYMMKIKFKRVTLTIYDTLKIIPLSELNIATSFNLDTKKGSIDYEKDRDENYIPSDEEIEYIKNDCYIIKKAHEYFLSDNLTKATLASNAFSYFKSTLNFDFRKCFPVIDLSTDKELRKYYKGGYCYLTDNYKSKIVHDVFVYDVNSLYPYVMYINQYPCGTPKYFKGKYKGNSKLVLHHIKAFFILKDGYLPTIQIKNNNNFNPCEYLKSSDGNIIDLYLPELDLKLFLEHYDIPILEYIDGYEFKSIDNLFKKYIDKWISVKINNKGGKKALAKLMLNALYGKFALNPVRESKRPYLNDENSLSFETFKDIDSEPIYTPISIFVTSYARYHTISNAQKYHRLNRLIYCDTDSLHIIGARIKDLEIHDSKLGAWKLEEHFYEAKYLHQKCYFGIDENKKKYIKIAGLPKDKNLNKVLNIENFKYGFTYGECLKSRQINGGIYLKKTPFKIR